MQQNLLEEYELRLEQQARKSRKNHLAFMNHTWQRREDFIIGFHTREICRILDVALEKYRIGISSFIDISLAFRHGKSDIVSRYLPPHFLGEFPSDEIMLISYGDDLSTKFSKFSRKLIQTPEFNHIYPDVKIDRFNKSVHEWAIDEDTGIAQYSGLAGGLSGKGYNLGICDDLFKNREQADSEQYRHKIWEAYTNDFLSRRAPVSITINLNTRWHEDDHNGRIKNKMEVDPEFPKFEIYSFPAMSENYKTGYLFPERFSEKWYREQKSSLGDYGFQSLMQQDPTPRDGNQFKGVGCQIIQESDLPSGLDWVRGWDLASSSKQLSKSDPDYTSGPLLADEKFETGINGLHKYKIYVRDLIHGQWEAPERNEKIVNASILDGSSVSVAMEGFGAYKDAFLIVQKILMGSRSVEKLNLEGNKIAKASVLEPVYQAGNIYLVENKNWNDKFTSEFKKFPGGKHDDIVDSVVVAFNKAINILDLDEFDMPI